MWLTYIPVSLWAAWASCLTVAISTGDRGICTHTARLSPGILAIFLRTWLCIINLVIYACKSLWPLQQCACMLFFLCTRRCKRWKGFLFFLFFFLLYLSLNWMPRWKCHRFISTTSRFLNSQSRGSMEKCAKREFYKLNGHLSTLLLISSFARSPTHFRSNLASWYPRSA